MKRSLKLIALSVMTAVCFIMAITMTLGMNVAKAEDAFRIEEGFSKYSRFLYSRMIPSFSTIRLKRLIAFSRFSESSTMIVAIKFHLPAF